MDSDEYKQLAAQTAPKSNLFSNCVRAFIIGGLICVLGQFFLETFARFGFSRAESAAYTSFALIALASLATGFGVYDKLGKFAGAGSVVPITGFANSMTAPAIEYKKEGLVFGIGARMFIIAGPVILYGTLASVAVGAGHYITQFFK